MMLGMPHPSRIAREDLIAAARSLLEEHGEEGVTMREIARRLDVKAPSLYFHVHNRDELLRELIAAGLRELGSALAAADDAAPDPIASLHAQADAYAAFAAGHRNLFALLFEPCIDARRVDAASGAAASAPLLDAVRRLGVPDHEVLPLSQALWSLVHGYTVLALADQFQMGGDPAAALHDALRLLLLSVIKNC